MRISKATAYVNGVPIWEYSYDNEVYLVREYGNPHCKTHNYIIRSPSNKLYCFNEISDDLPVLFSLIKSGKADKDYYACDIQSIYDEI